MILRAAGLVDALFQGLSSHRIRSHLTSRIACLTLILEHLPRVILNCRILKVIYKPIPNLTFFSDHILNKPILFLLVIPSSESSGNASQAFAQHHMTQQHILHAGGYSSQPNSHPSQNSPIVPIVNAHAGQHHLSSLHSNINNNNPLAGPSNAHLPPPPPPKPDPPLLLDEDRLQALQDELVRGTNEYTIEQLEQVNAAIMDTVWRNRNSWDRNMIIDEAKEAMSEVFDDIKEFNALVALGKRQDEEASQRVGNVLNQRLLGLV